MHWFGNKRNHQKRTRHRRGEAVIDGAATLADLGTGQSARILRINGSGPLRRRLIDLGLHAGETVEMIRSAPLRDPLEIALNGGRISIRRSEAALVNVEFISDRQ